MTWSPDETRQVTRALLGTWPGTIVQWGEDAIDAYLYVLQARGLTADEVLRAIGTWPAGSDFPPSAPNLAAQARKDPSAPTFEEALVLIRRAFREGRRPLKGTFSNEAQMIGAREAMVRAVARQMHPLIATFVDRSSDLGRLEDEIAELAGGEYAGARRHELEQRWEAHCEAMEGRDVAALASGRRGEGLGRLDPLTALSQRAPTQITAGGDA